MHFIFKNWLVKPQKMSGAKLKGTVAAIASLCIVFALFFSAPGCNKQDVYGDDSYESIESVSIDFPVLSQDESIALSVLKNGSYALNEDEAISKLLNFSLANGGKIDGNLKSSNNSAIVVKSSNLKKSPQTGKDMYYEFTFESDKGTGFAIVSADVRIPEVLYYSEVGSIADTSYNKSLQFCLEMLDIYVEENTKNELDVEALAESANEKISESAILQISSFSSLKALPFFDPNNPESNGWIYDGPRSVVTQTDRVKQVPGGWHQGYPFNEKLPFIDPPANTVHAHVGCAMVAVAQILSYHQKAFRGYIGSGDWTAMIANPNVSISLKNFIRDVFDDMVTTFDASGSSSTITKARSFLGAVKHVQPNGLSVGSENSYNFSDVWSALQYGPTYIQGQRQATTGKIGHAWVIDGARMVVTNGYDLYYCIYGGKRYEIQHNPYTYTNNTVRYDWGWGNTPGGGPNCPNINGWFSSGVFQVPGTLYTDRNYKYDVEIISFIKYN